MQDGINGREMITWAKAQGWTEVDMFERDFDRHQAYLDKFRDMYEWVKVHAGMGGEDWLTAHNSWFFKDANKAMLFKLTWRGA